MNDKIKYLLMGAIVSATVLLTMGNSNGQQQPMQVYSQIQTYTDPGGISYLITTDHSKGYIVYTGICPRLKYDGSPMVGNFMQNR